MRIIDIRKEKIKSLLQHEAPWIILSLGLCVFAFFGGVLFTQESLNNREEIQVLHNSKVALLWESYLEERKQYPFVAAREGAYVYPRNCKLSGRIKEDNRVYFEYLRDAKSLGYLLHDGC